MRGVTVSTNGCISDCLVLHQSHGPISCAHKLHFQPFNHCSHANLGLSVCKKIALLSEIYFPRTSLIIGSTKMNVVAFRECGFPFEEEVDGKFEGNFVEQILPPRGNSENCEDSELEHSALDQAKAIPEEKVMLSVDNVHFLEEMDEEILSNRILVLSRMNKVRSAMELLGSMELSGLCPNLHAFNSLLSCLFRNGLVDDGMRLFELMKRKNMTTGHTCSLILKGVADARGCDAALKMFTEMEEEIEVKRSFDSVVYNTMISVCGRVNNWIEALRLWRSMKENHLSGTRVTYCVLVCTFVRCGQNELALDAYSEMIRGKFEPGSDTMQAVIGASAKEGNWELALGVFQDMLKRELKPNDIACNTLINSLGKAGEIKMAFEVFEIMKSLGHTPDTYTWNAMLGTLYKANRHDEALLLFESIKKGCDSQPNLHLYNTALISCSKLGLWGRALQLMWEMEANGISPSTASFNLVIGACETAKKPDVAVQVYKHMVHRNCDPDTFTHLLMIRVCIWGSLWDEVHEILNASPDASLYNAAIQGKCLRGKVDSAKKLYSKMRNLGLKPDGKTRALMLQNLRINKNNHKYRRPFRRRRTRTNVSSLSL